VKVLFVSNVFPDLQATYLGTDNATVLHQLSSMALVSEVRVLSPRPTLPLDTVWRGRTKRVPRPRDADLRPVFVDTYYVPKVGSRVNHLFFAHAIREPMRAIHREFPFDRILCCWTYPDGCGVSRVAAEMGLPYVIIAQGSDVHAFLRNPIRRPLIVAAAQASKGVITRSAELARLLREAGVDDDKLHPIYNGVDASNFHAADQAAARQELGIPADASVILFVGNLFEVKNPTLLIAAHAELCRRSPDRRFELLMIGDGPLRASLEAQARSQPSGASVRFLGKKLAPDVARAMQAADTLCVSSHNEGVPNVVLESFACGLRVVSTRVGGIPEVLCHDFLGRLVAPGNVAALSDALHATLSEPPATARILEYAGKFTWENAARAYAEVLRQAR
jgi:teichuronic acid biosynthesis glycosyltransferase TuaC